MKTSLKLLVAMFVILLTLCNFECPQKNDSQTQTSTDTTKCSSSSEHLVMGNPSCAKNDTSYSTNYLMEKPQYVVSYNRNRGTPNWVAWHLNASWIGHTHRQDDFRNDTSLPTGWYQVKKTSYQGSGYARGHHCPSADRTNSIENNSATFLMTNMMPQAANNNSGPWEKLEDYCRTLVTQGKELYIYAGGAGSQGTINNGHVTVPLVTWKVIMVLNAGDRVSSTTRLIAVDMPNSNDQISRTDNWRDYRVSVDSVESITGYDFFSTVPAAVQTTIESAVDSL